MGDVGVVFASCQRCGAVKIYEERITMREERRNFRYTFSRKKKARKKTNKK